MPFLTGGLLQQRYDIKYNIQNRSFYALSNGRSVATKGNERKELEIICVSMPFLTGGLLQRKTYYKKWLRIRVSMPFLTGGLLQQKYPVFHGRMVFSFYALSNGRSVAT